MCKELFSCLAEYPSALMEFIHKGWRDNAAGCIVQSTFSSSGSL